MFKFSKRSIELLSKCDHKLMLVANTAIKRSPYDFSITETLRDAERQAQLFKEGKSKTLHSRHLPNINGLSEALDFAVLINNKVTWDQKYYRPVIQAFFEAAIEHGVQIESGALWITFIDCPHIQLKSV